MINKGSKSDRIDELEMALLQLLLEDLKSRDRPIDQNDCSKTLVFHILQQAS